MSSFGAIIRSVRKSKKLTQRELAKLLDIDCTYLSKIECDRAGYPPSEIIINKLAFHLDLDKSDLFYLSGRIHPDDKELFEYLVKKYKEVPRLFSRMLSEPEFAKEIIGKLYECEGADIKCDRKWE